MDVPFILRESGACSTGAGLRFRGLGFDCEVYCVKVHGFVRSWGMGVRDLAIV